MTEAPEIDQTGVPEWQKWKKTQSPSDLAGALRAVDSVIDEVPRANPKLSRSLLRGQAKGRAIEALNSFDPEQGASLKTHVRNHLKPLTMRSHGQTRAISRGRFVEETATEYRNEMREFEETMGREPTAGEMADRMKISGKRSSQLMERSRQYEVPESQMESLGAVPGSEDSRLARWTEFVYHDLTPRDQLMMDYRLGRNGKPQLGLEEIAEKLGTSTTTVHKVLNRVADRIMTGAESDKQPAGEMLSQPEKSQ